MSESMRCQVAVGSGRLAVGSGLFDNGRFVVGRRLEGFVRPDAGETPAVPGSCCVLLADCWAFNVDAGETPAVPGTGRMPTVPTDRCTSAADALSKAVRSGSTTFTGRS